MEKNIEIHKAPWYIIDEPKFPFRGLLLGMQQVYLHKIFCSFQNQFDFHEEGMQ